MVRSSCDTLYTYVCLLTMLGKMRHFPCLYVLSNVINHKITPVLPNAGQKLICYFEGYLECVMAFQNLYLFTPQFLVQLLTMFC